MSAVPVRRRRGSERAPVHRRNVPTSHWIILASVYLAWVVGPVAPALAADPVTIVITDTLDPATVTVEAGTSITWRNDDGERHRVRSTDGPEEFDSGNLEPGETFTFTPSLVGTISYLDERDDENPSYFGTIVVTDEPVDEPPPDPSTGGVTVDVADRLFVPANVTVALGTAVTWDNVDDRAHTVTANDGSFDSGIFDVGATYTRAFETSGVFSYLCTLHPEMIGTVTVLAEDGSTPAPDPTPPPEPDPPPDPTPVPPPSPGDVSIFDNGFSPETLTVAAGATVTWTNTGAIPHTVTDSAGGFDSGFLLAGDTYARTFDAAGSFLYLCTIHPEMTASIVVTGPDGEIPPPPPPVEPTPPPPEQPPSAPGLGGVTVFDNGFAPTSITVKVGSTISWTNTGSLPHTVTDRAGAFDSGIVLAGETYAHTFDIAGTFQYLCTIHPEMTATVSVVGEDGVAPPPEPPLAEPVEEAPSSRSGVPSSVSIVDNAYRPAALSVAAGSTITWANSGDLPHTVTDASGEFDSGILMPGDGYRRTFDVPGTYAYLCTIHPEMTASITVTEGGTPTGGDAGADGVIRDGDAVAAAPAPIEAGPTASGEPFSIGVIDLDYDPRAATVPVGTTVVWTNEGAVPHTVTAAGLFDSGIMNSGAEFSFTFDDPGTYVYLCTLHPGMEGRVIVDVDVLASGIAGPQTDESAANAPAGLPDPPASRFSPTDAIVVAIGVIAAVLALAYGLGSFSKAPSAENAR